MYQQMKDGIKILVSMRMTLYNHITIFVTVQYRITIHITLYWPITMHVWHCTVTLQSR